MGGRSKRLKGHGSTTQEAPPLPLPGRVSFYEVFLETGSHVFLPEWVGPFVGLFQVRCWTQLQLEGRIKGGPFGLTLKLTELCFDDDLVVFKGGEPEGVERKVSDAMLLGEFRAMPGFRL
ncbi:hypothetical protein ACJRO7_007393 [Eucalyptus globulus]|uniref:Uncharacterized protein n=1 Tax=Eucalyptus globulus TaxID=34317 RepID=A0ABD3INM0_EUCGL